MVVLADVVTPPEAVLSEVPFVLWLVLFVGVFSAVTWGMMVLFRGVTHGRGTPVPEDDAAPD